MQQRKLKVGIVRFPYAGNGGAMSEHPAIADWLARNIPIMRADDRIEDGIVMEKIADTPITMTRNRALYDARAQGVDVLLMLDSDQVPDLHLGHDATAKPFWESSFDFFCDQYDKGPCCIAAPYCGPDPDPNKGGESSVYIFQWASTSNDKDLRSFSLSLFGREEAAQRMGIEEVAALPTGMILIDVRVVDHLTPPWFDYEYKDKYQREKASTEDVFFTRNCSMQGIPQYVNWDAWAGHVKQSTVGKPLVMYADHVSETFREAVLRNHRSNERVMDLNVGKSTQEILAALPDDIEVRTVSAGE